MSFFDSFPTNLGNYAPSVSNNGTAEFVGTTGNPAAGCAKLVGSYIDPTYSAAFIINSTDTYLVGVAEHLYFNARLLADGVTFSFTNQIFWVSVQFADAATLDAFYYGFSLIPNNTDSGWLQFDFSLTSRAGKTINYIHFGLSTGLPYGSQDGQVITAYVDTISVGTTAPAFDPNPPAAAAKFYQGSNSLALKSALPMAGVNPGAMAISPDGQIAVVGANAAASPIVAYSANPWASWSNMSGGMPTGTPVTSIKYV